MITSGKIYIQLNFVYFLNNQKDTQFKKSNPLLQKWPIWENRVLMAFKVSFVILFYPCIFLFFETIYRKTQLHLNKIFNSPAYYFLYIFARVNLFCHKIIKIKLLTVFVIIEFRSALANQKLGEF